MKKGAKPHEGNHYKVVEVSSVTDIDLEEVLNKWTNEGWTLDSILFAMRESSKRPAMAFVVFVRSQFEAVH